MVQKVGCLTHEKRGAGKSPVQVPVTQDYLANTRISILPALFVNLASAGFDATAPQLHTEVSSAGWLPLLISRAGLKVGTTFPPGLLHPGQ